MMKPEAFKNRGNTNNTGYGFEQVLDPVNNQYLHQPDGNGIRGDVNNGSYDPAMDHNNIYQYAVPGNMGALKQANKW